MVPNPGERETDEREEQSDPLHADVVVPPPDVPKLNPKLPDHPNKRALAAQDSGSYGKSAMASNAVTAFLMPIVTFCLGGYWLDQRLKHTTSWISIIGVIVGLVIGLTSMMRVLDRMSK